MRENIGIAVAGARFQGEEGGRRFEQKAEIIYLVMKEQKE